MPKGDAKGSQDWSKRVPQAADRGIKGQEGAAGGLSVKCKSPAGRHNKATQRRYKRGYGAEGDRPEGVQ
jgi:hypothetical protein